MGILGYPNMDDNNHDGIFGDYSDIYSNYSSEEGSQAQANAGATPQSEGIEGEELQDNTGVPPLAPQSERQNNNRLLFYLLILGLLLVAAVGMFVYKKHSESIASQEQSMSDYFQQQNVLAEQQPSSEPTAIVDVDLSDTPETEKDVQQSTQKEQPVAQETKKEVAKKVEPQKDMNAAEKAAEKKKNDEQREKQIALSSNPVIIPVNAGGRLDPFVPYLQSVSNVTQDQFELIAPPTTIPEVDPVIDELVNTKISGIMFDTTRPSAIVNFGGVDHLVHKGDIIKGFKIVNITKDSVVISYQANIYQVSVGQSLNDGLNINSSSSLSSSFGGAYSKTPQNIIQINN